jgi:transcriptional regulator with XRE-family HTH domain
MNGISFENRLYSKIGGHLKELRKSRGYTQEDVANAVGLTRTSVVNIEKGRQRVPLHILFAISKFVNVEVEPRDLIPTLVDLESPDANVNLLDQIVGKADLSQSERDNLTSFLTRLQKE